ncbi:ATP synthase subunit O, mitochondrial [Kappamyces sp. JEL0680]|nr:ATP synthase subunit O, mitochondrial [Kappamyces sp. JEL0680]
MRGMATAAKAVQVPLKLHGIDGRYATALFSAASKSGTLAKVDEELQQVKALLDKDAGVKRFLETPVIDRQAKKKGIEVILGNGKSETTVNFFNLLAENGRLGETSKIISAYTSLMIAHRGEVNVVVISAKVCCWCGWVWIRC